MKKHLLRSMAAGTAMLLGAVSLSAAMPEHLYMVGTASPSLWNLEPAQEMVNEGEGVFSYTGNLYNGELQFMNVKNWDTAVRYVPEVGGWHITDAGTATIVQHVNAENKWWVPDYGTWKVKVFFGDDGNSVMISAERLGDMAPQAIALGAATGHWDCAWPAPTDYLKRLEGDANIFVWEGSLTPIDNCTHIKFISYPKAWDQGCIFYVPTETDFNGNVKLVRAGDKLKFQTTWNGNGPLDDFWGFRAEDCTPDKMYRVTLNLDEQTVEFSTIEVPVPEHLYMVGLGSPTLWDVTNAHEMTAEGNGTFSYHGTLYKGQFRFVDTRDWATCTRYVPQYDGQWLTNAVSENIYVFRSIENKLNPNYSNNNWWIGENGTYDVKVTLAADGGISVQAERVGDMPAMAIPLGAATGQWNTDAVPPTYNIYPKEGTEDVFVWEGVVKPGAEGKHLKFISHPSNYWETNHYVPESTDNGTAKFVKIGDKLKVQKIWGNPEGAPIDTFWGFADEDCTPEKKVRATLNLGDNTIEFAEADNQQTGVSDIAASELKVSIIGGAIVVEGADSPIAVYDIAGRRLAYSEAASLTVPGLPKGVYVVKTAAAAVKVAK